MAAILNSAILNLAILDSAILVFPLKLTHTCQDWFPPFAQKNFTHSFWLNLMMAAILNSAMLDSDTAILDSDTLLFSQIHSKTLFPPLWLWLKLIQLWLKLIHSDSTWWWQPSWILPCWIQTLPSWIQTPCYLLSDSLKNTLTPLWLLTQTNSIWLKLIHSHSTWWWQPSWILPSWIWPSWIQPS